MALTIFPGNYVNHPSAIRGLGIVGCYPGRITRHLVGYVKITTSATSWDVIIPSDDKRQGGDKTRPDQVGMVLPVGACVYHVGLRVVDSRRNRDIGSAVSGLLGTDAQELKLASALNVDPAAAFAATAISSPAFTIASTTVAPGQVLRDPLISTGVIITGSDLTLKVFNCTAADAAGAGVSSTLTEGSYLIAEACYTIADDVPSRNVFGGFPSNSG
jgi:hypothetical protein